MAKTYHADYQAEIDAAVKKGDYASAAKLEQERNEKIAVTGSSQKQTNLYSQYLNGGSSGSAGKSSGSAGSSLSLLGSAAGAMDRAVGVGSSGVNLGAYKDANGNTSTYRPEFAGQTVQIGTQYVTYDERGYPTKSMSVKHAQSLGNDYTKNNLGLDQTKISNAADIYQGIYNAAMKNDTIVSGSGLNNAFGKRNIGYNSGISVEDYEELIREAAEKGNYLLAGYYEDSRNALIADQGLDPMLQSSNYNGGWNWVDNGGGVGNIYTGALQDPTQTDQALGGGWYAGLGKGDAAEEYFHLNTDAPTMDEVLGYAKLLGYDVDDETATIPLGDLARQMMAGGYVSPETLQKAETLKVTIPAAMRNLGMESDSSGTEALNAAITNMQNVGGGLYTKALQDMQNQNAANGLYSNALQKVSAQSAGGNPIRKKISGSGSSSLENELKDIYSDDGSYAETLKRLREQMDAEVKQVTSAYEKQKDDVNRSYADMFRQLYIDRENSRKNMDQQMAAYGVTGGAAESTLLGLNTDYQNALREGERDRIDTVSELDRAILQAQLTGDIAYLEQALAMEQTRQNNYASVLQNLLNRQDDVQQQAYNRQLAAQQQAYEQALKKAELLAKMGDFSGYKMLGLTDEEITALNTAYAAANTPKTSSAKGVGQSRKSEESVAPKSTLLFSDLIDTLETGKRKGVEQYVDSVWDTLTEVQKREVEKLLNQYGYTFHA